MEQGEESSGVGVRVRRREAMEGGPRANTRRRRLVERGSDRLAFITGQTRALPSDPYPDSPLSSTASPQISEQQSGIGSDKFSNIVQLPKAEPSHLVPEIQPSRDARQQKLKDRTQSYEDELYQKFKTGSAVPEIQPVNETPLRRRGDENLSKNSNDGAASVQHRKDMETGPRSSVPPSQSNQSDDSAWTLETLKELVDFTPHEITQAISATEYNRFLASIGIAFLVVLSNWGLDVGGIITRVLICTRPLLFLIITNITIVMSLLMENKDPNARGRSSGSNLGSADSLGQMLELGLLLQKALGGLLMDCSVCAVIMICFLGF